MMSSYVCLFLSLFVNYFVPMDSVSLFLCDKPFEEELPDVGELGVDDGGQGGVHVGKRRRCRLSLDTGDNIFFH